MLHRIRPRPLLDLARRDLPGPLDVINLIHTGRWSHYRWYALLVTPPLLAVGGRPLWMGRTETVVHGERQADKFLVVRYPSQRRFLAMTLNPYYLAINLLRESGVRRFEASFTHAMHTAPQLRSARTLVAVHLRGADDDAIDAVRALTEPIAGPCVYATRAVASLGFLEPPAPTDPHPLSFPQIALFAPPRDAALPLQALAELAPRLEEHVDACVVQVYRQEPASVYRPSLRGGEDEHAAAPAARPDVPGADPVTVP
ncbi:DUF1330 domain-containing protein [Paraconexibacter algicola]|uniref:DUF1330 domain-containing protein n=1 Tax=Paraconexibacter algicola TaxID=2133960 RepID=A0A2T4UGL1_9ACTN|nr:DUF1330 domain-containing protein [Paraconexibacter algicola]PTL58394.1 hypothetical protein C7Y72_01380 [Paraconexibacter algicola]